MKMRWVVECFFLDLNNNECKASNPAAVYFLKARCSFKLARDSVGIFVLLEVTGLPFLAAFVTYF